MCGFTRIEKGSLTSKTSLSRSLPQEFAPPAPPLNVAVLGETGAAALVGGEPSWHGEIAHPTPKRQLMCILSRSFATTASDGETRTFVPGDLLLLEDVDGKGHGTTAARGNRRASGQ